MKTRTYIIKRNNTKKHIIKHTKQRGGSALERGQKPSPSNWGIVVNSVYKGVHNKLSNPKNTRHVSSTEAVAAFANRTIFSNNQPINTIIQKIINLMTKQLNKNTILARQLFASATQKKAQDIYNTTYSKAFEEKKILVYNAHTTLENTKMKTQQKLTDKLSAYNKIRQTHDTNTTQTYKNTDNSTNEASDEVEAAQLAKQQENTDASTAYDTALTDQIKYATQEAYNAYNNSNIIPVILKCFKNTKTPITISILKYYNTNDDNVNFTLLIILLILCKMSKINNIPNNYDYFNNEFKNEFNKIQNLELIRFKTPTDEQKEKLNVDKFFTNTSTNTDTDTDTSKEVIYKDTVTPDQKRLDEDEELDKFVIKENVCSKSKSGISIDKLIEDIINLIKQKINENANDINTYLDITCSIEDLNTIFCAKTNTTNTTNYNDYHYNYYLIHILYILINTKAYDTNNDRHNIDSLFNNILQNATHSTGENYINYNSLLIILQKASNTYTAPAITTTSTTTHNAEEQEATTATTAPALPKSNKPSSELPVITSMPTISSLNVLPENNIIDIYLSIKAITELMKRIIYDFIKHNNNNNDSINNYITFKDNIINLMCIFNDINKLMSIKPDVICNCFKNKDSIKSSLNFCNNNNNNTHVHILFVMFNIFNVSCNFNRNSQYQTIQNTNLLDVSQYDKTYDKTYDNTINCNKNRNNNKTAKITTNNNKIAKLKALRYVGNNKRENTQYVSIDSFYGLLLKFSKQKNTQIQTQATNTKNNTNILNDINNMIDTVIKKIYKKYCELIKTKVKNKSFSNILSFRRTYSRNITINGFNVDTTYIKDLFNNIQSSHKINLIFFLYKLMVIYAVIKIQLNTNELIIEFNKTHEIDKQSLFKLLTDANTHINT